MARIGVDARDVADFNAAWRKRFGLTSRVSQICGSALVAEFERDFSSVASDYRLFSEALRSSSTPPDVETLRDTLFFQTFTPPQGRFSVLPEEETLDGVLFLAQTYVAQTIFAVFERYFSFSPQETQVALGASPFDWGGFVRSALAVDAQTLFALKFEDFARRSDPFANVYAKFFPSSTRQTLGEFYTPRPLAEYLYRRTLELCPSPAPTFLDPTCGAGVFLTTVTRDLVSQGVSAAEALERVVGFDLSPLAVVTARANVLVAATSRLSTTDRRRIALDLLATRSETESDSVAPISRRDALLPEPQARQFDVALGNPPWLAWDKLSAEYRRETAPLWREFGLFNLSAKEARYGGSKKELASLIVYSIVARRLKARGVLGFVLPRTLFQTNKAGVGFRRFGAQIDAPFEAVAIDDFSGVSLFPYVSSKASTLLIRKGAATTYPIPLRIWKVESQADSSREFPDDASQTLGRALGASVELGTAAPEGATPGAPLRFTTQSQTPVSFTGALSSRDDRQSQLVASLLRLGRSGDVVGRYEASLGANAAGGAGVFWLENVESLSSPVVTIRNLHDSGKRPVERVETQVESALVFPLLRWRDVDEYAHKPIATAFLCPQDPKKRRGFDLETMLAQYPRTLEYLGRFEESLRERAAYKRYQNRAPYWSLYNVDVDTFSPYKVVWRRMDAFMRATVVAPDATRNRPVVPQETLSLVPVGSLQEADYLCAALNSALAREIFAGGGASGSKSFGSPSVLNAFPIPVFDPLRQECLELAQIGRERRETAYASQNAELQ